LPDLSGHLTDHEWGALIAGNGQFPLLLAEEARRQGRSVVVAAIEGETDPALAEMVDAFHWMKLGQIKRTIQILKDAGADEAVMAGQVKHVSIFDLRHLDTTAVKIIGHFAEQKNRHDFGRRGGGLRQRGHPIFAVDNLSR
jgi:DUF1009 family protein